MSLEQEYKKRHDRALVKIAKALELKLSEYAEGLDRIERISARAKGVERFLSKAAKRDGDGNLKYTDPLSDIQDQVGARIITFYLDDVNRIERQVCRYFRAVEHKSLIPESTSEFSYVGRHFILFIPSEVTVGYDLDIVPKFFELQIKTLSQHAWAESNHDLAYKPLVPLSGDQKRLIAFTAAQAWGADKIFNQLYQELSTLPRITCETIDRYRGALTISHDDLKCEIWDVFDKDVFDASKNPEVVQLSNIVSTKNQLLDEKFLAGSKSDPRQVAFGHMTKAAANEGERRAPIKVQRHSDGMLYVIDGNATVQVLMMAKWENIPVTIVESLA